ncbi:MAG: hypothetical protein Q4G52_00680 [Clostridia bacterium]|nr:hypothetical protein [Clostridia bacterium]
MPNIRKQTGGANPVFARRVLASWRARAAAAAVAVGAQVFSLGAGVLMTVSLNAMWLAALAAVPASVLAALGARRVLAQRLSKGEIGGLSRALLAALCLTLAAAGIFQVAALTALSEQSLLPQAQSLFVALSGMTAAALCALTGGAGVARMAYAVRWALPLMLAVLTASVLSFDTPAGLFPLLGTGAKALGLSALMALSAAAPALMLTLPPPELDERGQAMAPGGWFFAWRAGLGALGAVLLLMAVSLCGTYETLSELKVWGMRMRVVCSGKPREGILQTGLTLLQLLSLVIGASAMLSGAEQAAVRAFSGLARRRLGLGLLFLLGCGALYALVVFGFDIALRAAPFLLVPTVVLLIRA